MSGLNFYFRHQKKAENYTEIKNRTAVSRKSSDQNLLRFEN